MSDDIRQALAYLNLVLVNHKGALWPSDKLAIQQTIAALEKLL